MTTLKYLAGMLLVSYETSQALRLRGGPSYRYKTFFTVPTQQLLLRPSHFILFHNLLIFVTPIDIPHHFKNKWISPQAVYPPQHQPFLQHPLCPSTFPHSNNSLSVNSSSIILHVLMYHCSCSCSCNSIIVV